MLVEIGNQAVRIAGISTRRQFLQQSSEAQFTVEQERPGLQSLTCLLHSLIQHNYPFIAIEKGVEVRAKRWRPILLKRKTETQVKSTVICGPRPELEVPKRSLVCSSLAVSCALSEIIVLFRVPANRASWIEVTARFLACSLASIFFIIAAPGQLGR